MKTGPSVLLLAAVVTFSASPRMVAQSSQQPTSGGAQAPAPVAGPANATPAPIQNTTPPAPPSAKFEPAPDGVFWTVFAVMIFVLGWGVLATGRHLERDRDWSLADLLSGADGKPSSSRLIAFLGSLVMIVIILGLGSTSLWVFLKTGQLPTLSGASTFLAASAGLFAPYFANQIGLAIGGGSATPKSLAPVVQQSASSALQLGPAGIPSVTFGPPTRPGGL